MRKKKEVTIEQLKRAEDACYKSFITYQDVKAMISDLPAQLQSKVAEEIGAYCEKRVTDLGKRLSDSKYLPTVFVLEYLAPYNITAKSISNKRKYYEAKLANQLIEQRRK